MLKLLDVRRTGLASAFEEVWLATLSGLCSRLLWDCHEVVLSELGLSPWSVAFDPIECSGPKG